MESGFHFGHVRLGGSTGLVLNPSFPAIDAMDFDIPKTGNAFDQIGRAVAFVGANLENARRPQLTEQGAPDGFVLIEPAVGKIIICPRRCHFVDLIFLAS
jgi:hypothetical protein